ncbi:hypothetical protein [Marivita sp.]|uniref:hypothetical protein n=1 Tax=Marivita sp. TaxID=2003365 RepID=UPI003F6D6F87
MSKGRWIIAVALGLALITSGQAQEQTESPGGQTGQEQNPIAPNIPTPFPVEIVENDAAADARQRSEEEARQREIADLAAQEGMNAATQSIEQATRDMRDYALYSTIAVWVGTFLLILNLVQVRKANEAAQKAVSVTRDIGEAQVRAYLGVVGIKPEKAKITAKATPRQAILQLNAQLKNSGQSPAFICRRYSRILISKKILEKIDIREEAWVRASMRIPAGGMLRLEADKPWSDIDAAIARGWHVYLLCGVEYEDVFFRKGRKRHVDHFCFLVDFVGPLESPDGAVECLPEIEWRDAVVEIAQIGDG